MTYRIHEIETNWTYDDVYLTREEAEAQIAVYKTEDDVDRDEPVTYEVIEAYPN